MGPGFIALNNGQNNSVGAVIWEVSLANSRFKPPPVAETSRDNAFSIGIGSVDYCRPGFDGSSTIPARMASVLVVIALIIPKLVLQVSRSPEESLIQ